MPHYRRKIDRPFTAKFYVGQAVQLIDGGKWTFPYGVIVEIKPDKRSHHYRVQMRDGDWAKLWFCEDELAAND